MQGTNVLAAEVHQRNLTSPDLSFSLSLTGYGIAPGGGGGGGGAGAGFSVYASAPPVSAEFQLGGELFQLVIVTVPGGAYLIEASDDLIDWSTLGTVTATGTQTVVSDPESVDGRAMRFYRVRLMP